ncbi:MAG TPA: hypothetical protein DCY13_03270 [Verrucomicrobiales bacterium]|nr:hypothetical protein [Verrucomicrobiales bacterium]
MMNLRQRGKLPGALPSLLTAFLLGFVATAAAADKPATHEQAVRDYVNAYNARDLDTMLRLVADDFQWLSITGDRIAADANGREALRKSMTAYFNSAAAVRSNLEWVRASASRVVALERATWKTADGERSQKSLSVYEFRGGLIARVYYFPAEK